MLGLFGGPLAHYADNEAGAVHFLPARLLDSVIVEAVWSLALPAIIWISDFLDLAAAVGGRYSLPPGRAASCRLLPTGPKVSRNSVKKWPSIAM